MRLRFAAPAPALLQSPSGDLADAPVRPCWALSEILSVHPQSPCGDSPGGACGSASLRRHLRCLGSLTETSLTLRCGPVGPSHLKPQSLRDSPLLRGTTPFLPPRRGTCRRPRTCSLIGNSMQFKLCLQSRCASAEDEQVRPLLSACSLF